MGSLVWLPADDTYMEAVVVRTGGAVATLSGSGTVLAAGTAYTSLPVTALPFAVASGDFIAIVTQGSSQVVVASGPAAAGATSIPVTSFVANFNYLAGAFVRDLGQGTNAETPQGWPGGERAYTFLPGVPKPIPPEDYWEAKALLQVLQGTMAAPAAPTVTPQGTTGAATWGYKVAAVGQGGDTLLSAQGQTTTGNATLTTGNFNQIARPTLPAHATGWRVIRSASGGTPAGINVDISGVLPASTATFSDTGIAGSAYVAASGSPAATLVVSGPADE